MAKEVQIVISAQDNASKTFKYIGKESQSFADKIKNNMNTIRVASGAVAVGLFAMGKQFVDSAMVAIEQETKLTTILKQRANATDEQIDKIKELASAQQRLGIIEDDTQIAGLQQLATFATTTETIEKLAPAMNNLIAQQKGFNATQGDAINIGNLMGKVLQGQVGALTRVGITFSAAQEEVLKFGTESERAAMLAQVITDNVGNMNQELGQTFQGRMTQLQNTLGDVGETIGMALIPVIQDLLEALLPVINKIADRITANPELTANILAVTAGIAGLVFGLTTLGPAIAAVIAFLGGPASLAIALTGVLFLLNEWAESTMTTNDYIKKHEQAIIELTQAYNDGKIGIEEYNAGLALHQGAIAAAEEQHKNFGIYLRDNFIDTIRVVGDTFTYAKIALDYLDQALTRTNELMIQIVEYIAGTVFSVFESFHSIVTGVGNAFDDLANRIFTNFMDKIQRVVAAVQNARSSITGLAGKAGSAIGSALGIGGERAIGGPMSSNTPYLVGERGPEIVVPSTASTVIPTNQLGSSGPANININIGGVTVSGEADENRLVQKITDALNRQTQLYQMGIN